MDTYWKRLHIEDYETYKSKFLHPIFLKPEVHENVRESFRVIDRLLQFGFYEHRFFDVAYSKAVLTLEMAFKQRYLEVEGNAWAGDLGPLMDWLKKRHYFDVYNKQFISGMRDIRNHFAHPSGGFAGPGQTHLLLYPMDLINSAYEDTTLTKQRSETHKKFHKKIESFGQVLQMTVGQETHLAFNVWLSFYDNKSTPSKIHVYVQPVYEIPIPYFIERKFSLSPFYQWEAGNIIIDDNVISLPDKDGRILEIRPISCDIERTAFLQWMEHYNDFDTQTGDKHLRMSFATDTFVQHLRQFHRC